MRVLVLGADGYLGWPTCMHFSQRGHEVMGIDNYFRRNMATELECEPLVPTPDLVQRAGKWEELTGKKINVRLGDITNYSFLLDVFREFSPDVLIHYAEQPSAPFSMMNRDTAALTLQNNLIGTLNVAYAVHEAGPDCNIVKLGTMGEYGTPDIDIEEGWLDIEHNGKKDRFLYPRQASSLYHTTKIQDTDMLWFYVRTWKLRVTDLMQGPVYGISTDECDCDINLAPNFNYDEVFGTVLNRFIVQAVTGHPLTIYGSGKQIRGFLNLRDTLQCVYLAATNASDKGELRIFNQITEIFSVKQLAEKVRSVAGAMGFPVSLHYYDNPRVEKEEHYYNPKYTGLLELGLKPHYLTDDVLSGMIELAARYKDRINNRAIFRGVKWR